MKPEKDAVPAEYRIEPGGKKHMSIRMKIWLLFMMFTAIVFILMWLLQIVFLQFFYPVFKQTQTKNFAKQIAEMYLDDDTDMSNKIQNAALANNACVEIIDTDGNVDVSVDVLNGKSVLTSDRVDIYILMDRLKKDKDGEYSFQMHDNFVQSDVIVYATVIGKRSDPEAYLFVDVPLAPVKSFIGIIKTQTLYIIAILLIIALFFSIYISNYISKPISRITKSSIELAHGNYNTKFDGKGYYEAEELAATLTYAENEISKVEQMQRDLIANTSHDLRTPLTMMKAYAEMIRDLSGDDPVKRNKHLQVIIDETDRLTALVNDILDLSKLESGKQKLEISEFDITSKMQTIYERYVELQEKNNYHIFFEKPKESCIVKCDEQKIERVICNLINNAINYTAKERNVYLRETITDADVLIEVEDTGDGIEQDKIKLIFDKYYRSENHKRETVGTGLGLSIVKTILQMHDYDFGVKSKVGKGSIFWFKIRR